MRRMTIGELARRAGVGVETVRFYQRRGLFPEPPRQGRSIREYSTEALSLLQFIRRLRGLGFKLVEIERLVALRRARRDVAELPELLQQKASELELQIRELETAVATLRSLAQLIGQSAPADRWAALDNHTVGAATSDLDGPVDVASDEETNE